MKTGPFAEHSNQLWNISGVANWAKVNNGLIKMYRAEVRPTLRRHVLRHGHTHPHPLPGTLLHVHVTNRFRTPTPLSLPLVLYIAIRFGREVLLFDFPRRINKIFVIVIGVQRGLVVVCRSLAEQQWFVWNQKRHRHHVSQQL